jgi:hypothetical protein
MTAEHAHALDAGGEVEFAAIEAKWLRMCGSCDAGLPMGCTHPDEDYRPVMASLVGAVEHSRQTAADTVLAEARRLCCGDNPTPHHKAGAEHSTRMAFAEDLARAVRGS